VHLSSALAQTLARLSRESNPQRALEIVSEAALDLTNSRYALIAVLNEEFARLEIRAGTGHEFGQHLLSKPLRLDVGRADGIVGYVAATGSSVMTGNVSQEPHYKKMFPNTQSEMAVPVRDRHGRVQAVLNVESDLLDAYGDDEMEASTVLSFLVAQILEREQQLQREEALIQIGTALDTALTEEALLERVLQVAEDVLRLQALSIFLLDERSGTFVLRGTVGGLMDNVGQSAYEAGEGFTGWVCAEGQPIMLDSPHDDPRWRGKYVEMPSEQIASFIAVPIVTRSRSIGAIRVLRKKSDNQYLDNRFNAGDLRILQTIAEQLAVGLESIRGVEKIIRSERMIAWGELSAKSSHMIGNRVFALKGDVNELGHLIAEPKPDLAEVAAVQRSLATNITRVEEILQDFRDFVTATQLHREATDLNQVLRETVDEVFPRRSSVQLELDLDDRIPRIQLDGKKLRRAFSELIENSLNYIDSGSLCVTSTLISREEDARVRSSKFATYVKLTVEDTGPGVNSDQKSTIFQPFFSKRVKGMGLGLSIVKGIIDAHGGEVYEAGEEGSGAKFVILLPVSE
jgi:signal transduction histidine kinase